MNISSIPDLIGYNQRVRSTGALKARLQTVAQEAVTGIQADLTKAAGGRVGELHLLQKALSDLSLEDRINSLASSRVDLISQGLEGARNSIDDLDTRAVITLSTDSETAIKSISEEAELSLKNVMASLSLQHGTRNLFSGDETGKTPFADASVLLEDVRNIVSSAASAADLNTALDDYFNDPNGGFNTRIYQGGTGDTSSIRLGNNENVPMDVRGNHDAIKATLRGLSVIATSTDAGMDIGSDNFKEIFSAGITSVSKGKTGLIALEGTIGLHGANIEKLNARNQAEAATITNAYQSIVQRDQFEAASELKQLEVALESSYVITSRLSNLSLVNFLR